MVEVRPFVLDVPEQALDVRLVGRRAGAAVVGGDRVQGHELAGRAGGHLRAVVGDREQDRRKLDGVGAGASSSMSERICSSRPSRSSARVNSACTWTCGRLRAEHRVDPLARDQIQDRQRARAGGREGGEVIAPDLVGPVVDPVRPRLARPRAPRRPVREHAAVREQHPQHRRRRDPHPAQVGAAVRELAMRAIDLAPLVGQLEDRLDLLGPSARAPPARPAVDRPAPRRRRACQCRARRSESPSTRHAARQAPAGRGRPRDQLQQRRLDLGVDARRDRAYQSERDFPRRATSSIACSLTVSSSRAISARSAASPASCDAAAPARPPVATAPTRSARPRGRHGGSA